MWMMLSTLMILHGYEPNTYCHKCGLVHTSWLQNRFAHEIWVLHISLENPEHWSHTLQISTVGCGLETGEQERGERNPAIQNVLSTFVYEFYSFHVLVAMVQWLHPLTFTVGFLTNNWQGGDGLRTKASFCPPPDLIYRPLILPHGSAALRERKACQGVSALW